MYGLIDYEGKKITKPIYQEIDSIGYKEGELLVKKDDKYGLINIEGKTLINLKYDSITCDAYYNNSNYNNAGYIVQLRDGNVLNGYIDHNYKIKVDVKYNELYRLNEIEDSQNIYLLAYENGQAGIIKNNELLVECKYNNIEYNVLNSSFIVQKGNQYGLIDLTGQEIIPIMYDKIVFEGVYVITSKNEKENVYKLEGKLANDAKYIGLYPTKNDNYYISIGENNLYGISNKKEEQIVENKYQYIEYIYEDFFIVTEDSKDYGVINSKDETVIEFEYTNIEKIEDFNMLQINKDNNVQIYNSQMNKILDTTDANIYVYDEYIKVVTTSMLKYFDINGKEILAKDIIKNNLIPSVKNSKWGYVKEDEEEVIEHTYDCVTEFNEYGYAGVKQDGKWGVIDGQGKMLVEPIYYIDTRYIEPYFIGVYYRQYNEFGEVFYTNNIE